MKKNNQNELVTRKYLDTRFVLFKDELKGELMEDIKSTMTEFRKDIFSKLDDVMGQLENLREDKILAAHQTNELRKDVNGHEERITKLEHFQPAA